MTLVIAGVLGAVIGSFLNVVIHRVPRRESIVRPGSRCPGCGGELSAWDNVPVLSFVLLGGRCRSCGMRISARYPMVEAATAALWVGSILRFDLTAAAAVTALAASVLLALALIDLEHRRLPNSIVLPATVVGLVWAAVDAGVRGEPRVLVRSVLCGTMAFVLFLLIALVSGGMGMGDVKLAGFIGLVTGWFAWEVAVAAVFASFFVGGLLAIGLMLAGRARRKTAIPFGPSMAAGALIALFAGPAPVRVWLGL